MMDGMTFMIDEMVPAGRYVLLRRHTVAHIGAVATIGQHWQAGDVVCVNQQTFDGLLKTAAPAIEGSAA